MQVKYVYLDRQYRAQREEILAAVDGIFSRSAFILRPEVAQLETALAARIGVAHAIGVNSGTDALLIGMHALDLPRDGEVLTVAHTFVSTVAAIVQRGLKPVLVDIGEDYNMDPDAAEAAITSQTSGILVVHLNGRVAQMDRIAALAKKRGLALMEDAAQALGAKFKGHSAGSFGDCAAFSLHPMKVLGAAGDAGFLTTSDAKLADDLRMLRNIGQRRKNEFDTYAYNSRLDTLQAAILLVKLARLDYWIGRRRALAARYHAALSRSNSLRLPPPPSDGDYFDIYSSYAIRHERRDALAEHLTRAGIETMIHWSPPLCRQPQLGLDNLDLPLTERISQEVLSIPIDPDMTDEEQDYVIEEILNFVE
ncbi:MAG TPA: DegT/DnrJ/EryC1/StrS family aminotransferase [Xanthobacteraceae bacterium]|nr:DegT/DnrJ/EryC1/StrS family aminotransferase [Xanthobacteraceae bacterium]